MFSSVELAGIEPATKNNLTWRNAELGRRETTPDDVNTVGTPVNRAANAQSYPQKLKRLNKFHSPDTSGAREHALAQEALPDATHSY